VASALASAFWPRFSHMIDRRTGAS